MVENKGRRNTETTSSTIRGCMQELLIASSYFVFLKPYSSHGALRTRGALKMLKYNHHNYVTINIIVITTYL